VGRDVTHDSAHPAQTGQPLHASSRRHDAWRVGGTKHRAFDVHDHSTWLVGVHDEHPFGSTLNPFGRS